MYFCFIFFRRWRIWKEHIPETNEVYIFNNFVIDFNSINGLIFKFYTLFLIGVPYYSEY